MWWLLLGVVLGTRMGDRIGNRMVSIAVETGKKAASEVYFATFDASAVRWGWNDVHEVPEMEAGLDCSAEDGEEQHVNTIAWKTHTKLFEEINLNTVARFLQRRKAFVLVLLCNCPTDARVLPALQELEHKYIQHEIAFPTVQFLYAFDDAIKQFQLRDTFLLETDDIPSILIDNVPMGANVEKYRMEQLVGPGRHAVGVEDIETFLSDFVNGQGTLVVRSVTPPPQLHQPGSAVEVTGHTWKEIVLDDRKHVLLFVYSPHCGGSRAVQPVFSQLAQDVHNKGYTDVVIARMDATVNDFPVRGIRLTHYPAAFLFPAGSAFRSDGSLRYLNWDDYNGSKTPHNMHIPVRLYYLWRTHFLAFSLRKDSAA